MTCKEALTHAMQELAADPRVRFIGYGLRDGGMGGTLKGVRREQIVETPVAENLMAGLATGMALRGLRPVVYFERMDFMLNALDAIVNHLDKIALMSGGEFTPAIIMRAVVGNDRKPLFTGETHVQNFTIPIAQMVRFNVVEFPFADIGPPTILSEYRRAHEALKATPPQTTLLVEHKNLL